jgi:uncharacterized protein RhaS with RHS repeats
MMDPRTGRWLMEDPLGFDGGDPNLYSYVGNDPTNLTDPSGQSAKEWEEDSPAGPPPAGTHHPTSAASLPSLGQLAARA